MSKLVIRSNSKIIKYSESLLSTTLVVSFTSSNKDAKEIFSRAVGIMYPAELGFDITQLKITKSGKETRYQFQIYNALNIEKVIKKEKLF